MIFGNIKDVEEREIKTFPFKGKSWPVKGTTIKWLSRVGDPNMPEYGLRLFTIKPGGYIPEHQHQYVETVIMLTGKLLIAGHKDRQKIAEREIGPGDYFYVPPMEPHGLKNVGNEPATLFCCICIVSEE